MASSAKKPISSPTSQRENAWQKSRTTSSARLMSCECYQSAAALGQIEPWREPALRPPTARCALRLHLGPAQRAERPRDEPVAARVLGHREGDPVRDPRVPLAQHVRDL